MPGGTVFKRCFIGFGTAFGTAELLPHTVIYYRTHGYKSGNITLLLFSRASKRCFKALLTCAVKTYITPCGNNTVSTPCGNNTVLHQPGQRPLYSRDLSILYLIFNRAVFSFVPVYYRVPVLYRVPCFTSCLVHSAAPTLTFGGQ